MNSNGKTIKQIADEIGVSKQRVYRFIKKNHISDAHRDAGVMYYDDVAESLVTDNFLGKNHIGDAHHDVHQTASNDAVVDAVISMLKSELDAKNEQLREKDEQLKAKDRQLEKLTAALEHTTESLHAAQALHAGTIQQQLTDGGGDQPEPDLPRNIIARLFKKKRSKEEQ